MATKIRPNEEEEGKRRYLKLDSNTKRNTKRIEGICINMPSRFTHADADYCDLHCAKIPKIQMIFLDWNFLWRNDLKLSMEYGWLEQTCEANALQQRQEDCGNKWLFSWKAFAAIIIYKTRERESGYKASSLNSIFCEKTEIIWPRICTCQQLRSLYSEWEERRRK